MAEKTSHGSSWAVSCHKENGRWLLGVVPKKSHCFSNHLKFWIWMAPWCPQFIVNPHAWGWSPFFNCTIQWSHWSSLSFAASTEILAAMGAFPTRPEPLLLLGCKQMGEWDWILSRLWTCNLIRWYGQKSQNKRYKYTVYYIILPHISRYLELIGTGPSSPFPSDLSEATIPEDSHLPAAPNSLQRFFSEWKCLDGNPLLMTNSLPWKDPPCY